MSARSSALLFAVPSFEGSVGCVLVAHALKRSAVGKIVRAFMSPNVHHSSADDNRLLWHGAMHWRMAAGSGRKRPKGQDTMDVPWEDLQLFLAIAESGSLSAASRQLRVGQPTISRRLADLE